MHSSVRLRRRVLRPIAMCLCVWLPIMNILPRLTVQAGQLQYVPQKDALYWHAQPTYAIDLDAVIANCPDPTDTDGDTLPDTVERILGTDPELPDSDFDRLDDRYEAAAGLNPRSPDSNSDGLSDYIEVNETGEADTDGDGIPNAWDADNDNDGVHDALDLSPFACTIAKPSFRFKIRSTGKPMYVNIQIRPRDPAHLNLPFQYFDWEDGDDKGTMQDTDNSKEDVCITPTLQVSASQLPGEEDLDKYGIYVIKDKAYIPLYTTDHFGTPSAFNGRIYYPGTGTARNIDLDARLVWMVSGRTDQGIVAPGDPYATPEIAPGGDTHMGGDMAMADINGNGTPDLVIMGVASHDLSYIIGWDVNDQGQPAGWSEKKSISGNAGAIQGGGVTLADLDGNGAPEMILMYAGNPEGANVFRYRIGWNLNAGGDAAEWSALAASPALGENNAGAGAAIGDIDGGGTGDLVFAAIDADSPDKQTNYYIGWNVAASGAIASWSGRKVGPGIVSNPAGGAGAELADLDGNGTLDLVLMALNEEEGANKMHFRVGWNLDAAGEPESWSNVVKGPFFNHENAGGGIAGGDFNHDGVWDMALGAVDDPGAFLIRIQNSFRDSALGNSPINLAKYPEDAVLTGFAVQENHGTRAGVLYSEDITQVMLANTELGYEFLRGQLSLTDVPQRLQTLELSVETDVQAFAHQDEALAALTGTMTPAALDALPSGYFPVPCALEDHAAGVEMGQIEKRVRYPGNTFVVDMQDVPVGVSKRIVTSWYDTDAKEALDPDQVVPRIQAWADAVALTAEATDAYLDLAMAWNVGETVMNRVGQEIVTGEPPETSEVMNHVVLGEVATDAVATIAIGIGSAYKAASVLRAGADLKNFRLRFDAVSQARVGNVSKMGRAIKGANAMGWVFTMGVAFYSFFNIAFAHGWSRMGVFSGAMYATLMTAYAVGLWAISCIPIVGGIISGLLALSDALVGWITGAGWSERAMDAIVDLFVDTNELSQVDLQHLDSRVTITDTDDNGVDVGDRIEVRAYYREYVSGDSCCWHKSYVIPYYHVVRGGASDCGTWQTETNSYWDDQNHWFERYWEVGAWVVPALTSPWNNYPLALYLKTDYKAYYEECIAGDCDVKSSSGTMTNEPSIIYIDVLPKNLEQFIGWNTITPLDTDGDGLSDAEELAAGSSTSVRMWDTDVDGLSDQYEKEVSLTSPNNRDSDFDGLPDGQEIVIGTNPLNDDQGDTDGDGLPDAVEMRGWDIAVQVGAETVRLHVFSDPTKADTDGDGLTDDWESLYRTNPRSTDTDGDGHTDYSVAGMNRFISQPYLDFGRDMGENYAPATPRLSTRVDPGDSVTGDVWRYCNTRIRHDGPPGVLTTGFVKEGICTASNCDESSISGWDFLVDEFRKDTYSISVPDAGVYFIREFDYWRDFESMPAWEEMPIIGVINTTGGDGWVASGDDLDNDGLIDLNEHIGWPVTFSGDDTHAFISTSNPVMADTDLDGLTDAEEHAAGTDARDRDTDHDCLSDAQEVALGSDPLHADTDRDGYWDIDEFHSGTNLFSWDSDFDGMNDNVAIGAGIDPLARLPMEPRDDAAFTTPGQPVIIDVLANDIYYGHVRPVIQAVTGSYYGQVTNNGDTLTYTPDPGFTGTDHIRYFATTGMLKSADVTVTVADINAAPEAYTDSCFVQWGATVSTLSTGQSSVLANDTDAEGTPLTAVLTVPPQHGTVTFHSDGTFSYHNETAASYDSVRPRVDNMLKYYLIS